MNALAASYPDPSQVNAASACGSPGTSSGLASGRPFDMHRYRTVFPDRWAALLRAHFRNSVEVAYFFGVDEKAARNWLSGTSGPSGAFVALAAVSIPGAMAALFCEAA